MITIIDNEIKPGKCVRAVLYTNDSELTGNTLMTYNGGTVVCEVGSIAMQAGFANMKQLDADGNWVDC